jgi:hypothetical protein
MKKGLIVTSVSVIVLLSAFYWFEESIELSDNWYRGQFVVITILALISLIGGLRIFKESVKGGPTEDEFSKRLLEKGASKSFFISLFWWVFLIFIKDRIKVDSEELIGTGILGMGVILIINILVIRYNGLKDGE